MAVELIYRIRDRKGNIQGEYMEKKTADIIDQRLDVMYELSDSMHYLDASLSETQTEKLALWMMDNREELMKSLKRVKDIPENATSE
jgi:dsDNA-binding SOS-regulon protein